MKTKNKRLISIVTLVAVFITFLLGTGIFFANAESETVYNIETLQAEYQYGDSLTLPDGYVEVGDNNYKLDTTVTYPDGRETNYKTLTLDCVGTYTVLYHTEQSGTTYQQEKTFDVKRTMANQFINVKDCEITPNVDGPANTTDMNGANPVQYNGVKVKATSASSQIHYNGIVNLAALKREKPFLEFLFTPEELGSIELSGMQIRLTDIYDENNYITMDFVDHAKYGPYEISTLIKFAANDMYTPTGTQITSTDAYVWDCTDCGERTSWSNANLKETITDDGTGAPKVDEQGKNIFLWTYTCPNCGFQTEAEGATSPIKYTNLWYSGKDVDYPGTYSEHVYGSAVSVSMYGKPSAATWYMSLPLYFDTDNQEVWGKRINRNIYGMDKQWKLFDFQDTKIIGTNVWDGFTTGEVYMDIYLGGSTKGANILITSVAGADVSGDSYVDVGAPTISVDCGAYTKDTLPHGLAGANCTYPIPKATAYSTNCGIIDEITTTITYVGEESTSMVPVINGRFATKEAGRYIIRYEAKDENGNSSFKLIGIEVDASYANAIQYAFDERIAETYGLGVDRIYLYEGVPSGGSGDLTMDGCVTLNGEEVEMYMDGLVPYFVPTVAGAYEFVCKVTDYIGSEATFTKTITVTDDGVPVFDDFYLPDAIRANYAYTLPTVVAKCGSADATVSVSVNGTAVTDGVYMPAAAGEITVVYTATNPADASKTATVAKTIKVLAIDDAKYASSYLLVDGMTYANASTTEITYEVTNSTQGSLFFANSIASSASIRFSFAANKANVAAVAVTLIDAVSGAAYKIDFVNTYGIPVVWHNGTRLKQVSGSFGGATANIIGFDYLGNGAIADATGTRIGKLTHSVDGKTFVEFGAEVYIKVDVIGAEAGTMFQLRMINNQAFIDDVDWAAPVIYFEKDYPTRVMTEYQSTVTVPKAQAFDVFGSVQSLMVKIEAPDLSIVYDGPIDQAYNFTASQIGTYRATYSVVDDSGNLDEPVVMSFEVADTVAPQVGIVGLEKVVYTVGETLVLPEFTATDNIESEDNLLKYVVVCDYENMYRIVEGSYTFTNVGTYRVRFVAADSSLNMSYKEILVYVVEK